MVVELLEDKKRWDQFVETSPQGLLFHKWDFLKTVERHSKYKLLPYCVYSGDQPICIFPFFVGRDHGLTVMNSPPPGAQIPYLGPAFDPGVQAFKEHTKEKILDQVTSEICEEIDKIAPNSVYFTTVPNFLDVRFFMWKNFATHLSFTEVIDLERSLDEIWASFSETCKMEIRRMSSHSPDIQQTNDVSALLDICQGRFSVREMQVPLLSDSYLKELVETFSNDVTVYSVNLDGKLVTATACCAMQKERFYGWIGNVNASKDPGLSDYLIWELVKRAKSEGFKKLDLGTSDQRLSKYKSKFDPALEPYCIVEKTEASNKGNFAYSKLAGSRRRVKQILRWRAKRESSSSQGRPTVAEPAGGHSAPGDVKMVVKLLEDKKRWDQFVEMSPQGSLFHKWDFLKTVERHSKYKLLPYCVYSRDQPICIFPFFTTRGRLGITSMFSPPPLHTQIPYLGPAFDPGVQAFKEHTKEKILDQVTSEICEEIDKIAPNSVYFTTVPNFLDVRFFMWKNFTANLKLTYVIDLERSLDEIWASFNQSCRRGIRRVNAYSPEIQQTNDVSPMLDIWRPRFSELGIEVPLLSDDYLKDLMAAFPQEMTVYNLTIDGKLATAIACCAMQKERYAYWIGGVSVRKDLKVQEYLMWEVIKQAKSEGFKKLDLGEPTQRTSRFKAKFDPEVETYCFVERTDT